MTRMEPDFSNVPLDTGNRCACSPAVPEDFRGIQIVAPKAVFLGERVSAFPINEPIPALPVCGTVKLPATFVNRFHSYWHEITLVAVNTQTHEAYSANLVGHDAEPSGGRKVAHPNLNEVSIGSWFNMNLFQKMESLPWVPGNYDVWATLGDIHSNVVRVKVTGEPSTPKDHLEHRPTPLLLTHAPEPLLALDIASPGQAPLEGSFRGVQARLSVDAARTLSSVVLHGRYQFGVQETKELGDAPLARALVVTVTSGLAHEARRLVTDEALFPDEEQMRDGIRRGSFHYRLGRALGAPASGSYYVMVSMGPWLARTGEVQVQGKKAVVVEGKLGAAAPR